MKKGEGLKRNFSELSSRVIGCAIQVHRELGPGLLESVYRRCLARELELKGIPFATEVVVPLNYKGLRIERAGKVDLVVQETLVLELKCVEKLNPVHRAQTLTYMHLLSALEGLLINFNVARLAEGGIVGLAPVFTSSASSDLPIQSS